MTELRRFHVLWTHSWRRILASAAALSVLVVGVAARSAGHQQPTQTPAAQPAASSAALVAQGEYLANRVAMCVQCHSPRDGNGDLLLSEKFRGAAMPLTSPFPKHEFAFRVPNIAGLPGFTDDQIIMLLTEGHAGDRNPPKPPMPPFRMTRQDAQAIVAYLRTF